MQNYKRVLVNGCSFTAISNVKNWPEHLPTAWKITNIAQSAAGNSWICDATIVETIKNDYDQFEEELGLLYSLRRDLILKGLVS